MIDAILTSVHETAELLRQGDSSGQVGSVNPFGDKQLKVADRNSPLLYLQTVPETQQLNRCLSGLLSNWHACR